MSFLVRFPDRTAAGRALAERVADDPPDIVLGVSNGGLVVAAALAKELGVELGLAWVRKVVLPSEPHVVLGAVDLDGDVTMNPEAAQAEGLGNEILTELAFHTHQRLAARARSRPAADIAGRRVAVVDDGLTTGLSLIAALGWARRRGAARRTVAVPVVDRMIWPHVTAHADAAVTLEERDGPLARSDVYEDFRRVDARSLARVLKRSGQLSAVSAPLKAES